MQNKKNKFQFRDQVAATRSEIHEWDDSSSYPQHSKLNNILRMYIWCAEISFLKRQTNMDMVYLLLGACICVMLWLPFPDPRYYIYVSLQCGAHFVFIFSRFGISLASRHTWNTICHPFYNIPCPPIRHPGASQASGRQGIIASAYNTHSHPHPEHTSTVSFSETRIIPIILCRCGTLCIQTTCARTHGPC